jgi:preprotein translocase subunit YajC
MMQNIIMFIIGAVIFVVYIYFLLSIIVKQHRIQRKEHKSAYKSSENKKQVNE